MMEPKVRYSDEDLLEFKELIQGKIVKAQEELEFTNQQIAELNESGFNQQGGDMYDDSSSHTELEFQQRMAIRQQKYIDDLKKALLRIQNKTYGVCIVTGELISKDRLRLVPHATKSVDGKNMSNSGRLTQPDTEDRFGGDAPEVRTPGKPVGDKVRIPNGKRMGGTGSEDWEMDNEQMEDAGYNRRKFEDDDEG
jgi:DnaK suppressor protein